MITYNNNKLQVMSQFKYDNYDDEFEDNPSSYKQPENSNNKQPQTFKVLVKQNNPTDENRNEPRMKNKSTHSVPGTNNKLVDEHIKIKTQLFDLAQKMDEIIEKQRQRKRKKNQSNIQDDERIVKIKNQLRQQQLKMQKNKTEIARMRKNMDSKYDMNKIVDKQNQLKHLKKQLHTLQQEKQSLQKIRKTQDRAKKGSEDKQSINKKSRMEDQLRQVTQRTKKQVQIINQKQKLIRKLHQQYIVKQQKFKQYQSKIKEKKPITADIHQSDIKNLESELKQLEDERQVMEKQGNQRIRLLQRQRKDLENQLKRRKLIFQERQKALRLNQMKHKQIIRLINSSQNANHSSVAESRIQKQSTTNQGKRTIHKNGRQAPKMQAQYDADFQEAQQKIPQQPKQQKKQQKSAVQKHDYGFSANIQNDQDIIAEI